MAVLDRPGQRLRRLLELADLFVQPVQIVLEVVVAHHPADRSPLLIDSFLVANRHAIAILLQLRLHRVQQLRSLLPGLIHLLLLPLPPSR